MRKIYQLECSSLGSQESRVYHDMTNVVIVVKVM